MPERVAMLLMMAVELAATGAAAIRWFHGLSGRKKLLAEQRRHGAVFQDVETRDATPDGLGQER